MPGGLKSGVSATTGGALGGFQRVDLHSGSGFAFNVRGKVAVAEGPLAFRFGVGGAELLPFKFSDFAATGAFFHNGVQQNVPFTVTPCSVFYGVLQGGVGHNFYPPHAGRDYCQRCNLFL